MRGGTRRLAGMAAVASLLAGCADGRVIVTVDLLSFVSEPERSIPYTIPAGAQGSVQTEVTQIEILEGVGGSTLIDSVRITGLAEIVNATGSGTFEFRIFLDSLPFPFTRPAAIVLQGTVTPGATTEVPIDQELAAELLPLFEHPTIYAAVEADFQSTDPLLGPSLSGTVELRRLLARIVGREDIF